MLSCLIGIGLFTLAGHGTARRVIAFVTIVDYRPQLHLMDVQRRITRQISHIPVFSCCPKWSPDGTQIAFNGNNEQNYVVDVYGGETRLLTPTKWSGWVMGWSADGQQVILRSLEATNGSLYRVDADGENFGLLAEGASNSMYLPLLSTDGRFAFYALRLLDSNDWKIFRLNLEDGTDHLFINENYRGTEALAFASAGGRAAFASAERREVLVLNTDGSNIQHLATSEDILAMAWSPDGRQILFLGQDAAGVQNVYVTDGDGQHPHDLNLNASGMSLSDFSWSPDGAQISFGLERPIGKNPVQPDIYVMDADGSHVQQLTFSPESDVYPAWQPGM